MAIKQVGAQDPELKNSPICESRDEEVEVPEQDEQGLARCHFNDQAFLHGDQVLSGETLLECDHGIWVEVGPVDSDHL
jgi:hypothetical protein